MQTTATPADLFGEPIAIYTRAQAIEDGVLVDVSETAREAGIVWSVAMTSAAWGDCVAWDEATESRKGWTGQSEPGRLWDVCWMLSLAVRGALRRGHNPADPLLFQLVRVPRAGRGLRPRAALLKALIGPDDTGRPCITVMLPGED